MPQSAAMVPLSRTLKMEMIDAHKAPEERIAESLQTSIATVYVIRKWQLAGAVRGQDQVWKLKKRSQKLVRKARTTI